MSWTEHQINTLKQMWGNGYSASEIAKSLGGGLTRNAVIGKAHRLKLSTGSGAASVKRQDPLSTNLGGSVLASMTKVSKKRVMLRPLPPVQMPEGMAARNFVRETPRPIDNVKRGDGIAVTKAGERQCRWPIGDPRSPDFRFCGCTAHEGMPYCVDHARVAYQSVSRRARGSDPEATVASNASEFRMPGSAGRY